MSRVKGGKISSKLAFVRDQYGERRIAEVLGIMTAGDREAFAMVLDTQWYNIETYDRLVRAICQTVGEGDETIYEKMGAHSAEQAYATTYRVFRGKDPADLVKKFLNMHSMRNDPSEIEVTSKESGHCTVKVLKPKSTEPLCKMSLGFFARAVELCGGKETRVREARCSARGDQYCQFELTWEA
jgi:uncharacterized protein (TIGR02265 family)